MSKFLFTLITLFAIKFSIFCDNCKKRYYFLQFGQSSRGLNIADHKRIDYDYDYYGYGDYRGGYSDPYYDDFYRYEDYYYDYAPPTAANAPRGGRGGRQPQPVGHSVSLRSMLLCARALC